MQYLELVGAFWFSSTMDGKVYPKEKKLVNITEYSKITGIDRRKVYRLLEAGKLTRYVSADGEPMLDPEEKPQNEDNNTLDTV